MARTTEERAQDRATEKAQDEKADHYVVLHDSVGAYWKGQTVLERHFPEGVDIERLVRVKAIAHVSTPEAATVLAGIAPGQLTPDNQPALGVAPTPDLTTGNPTADVQSRISAQQAGKTTSEG